MMGDMGFVMGDHEKSTGGVLVLLLFSGHGG